LVSIFSFDESLHPAPARYALPYSTTSGRFHTASTQTGRLIYEDTSSPLQT
jgi:hypothetical protein